MPADLSSVELTLTQPLAQKVDGQLDELDRRIWFEEADGHSVGTAAVAVTLMGSAVGAMPDWLSAAKSASYRRFVLKTLAEREEIRAKVRSLSREVSANRGPILEEYLTHYSVRVGCRPENALRNRYYQIEAYDRTRVIASGQGLDGRYLNANWVLERSGHKWWIATQAPLPSTVYAFLSLIVHPPARPAPDPQAHLSFQSRIRTVVQLTQNFENGRRKAHAYFPSDVGRSLVITPEEGCTTPAFKVTLLESRSFPEAHCIQSTVSIVPVNDQGTTLGDDENQETGRVVFRHMLYTSWPDHGVPNKGEQDSIIAFARLVDTVNRDTAFVTDSTVDPDPPVIVGCSAGVGRTGSFITMSSVLRSLGRLSAASSPTPIASLPPSPLGPLPATLANDLVAQEVDSLREQRQRMVDRDEQVVFIYEALVAALRAT